jgi:hypothetical protein
VATSGNPPLIHGSHPAHMNYMSGEKLLYGRGRLQSGLRATAVPFLFEAHSLIAGGQWSS